MSNLFDIFALNCLIAFKIQITVYNINFMIQLKLTVNEYMRCGIMCNFPYLPAERIVVIKKIQMP